MIEERYATIDHANDLTRNLEEFSSSGISEARRLLDIYEEYGVPVEFLTIGIKLVYHAYDNRAMLVNIRGQLVQLSETEDSLEIYNNMGNDLNFI